MWEVCKGVEMWYWGPRVQRLKGSCQGIVVVELQICIIPICLHMWLILRPLPMWYTCKLLSQWPALISSLASWVTTNNLAPTSIPGANGLLNFFFVLKTNLQPVTGTRIWIIKCLSDQIVSFITCFAVDYWNIAEL